MSGHHTKRGGELLGGVMVPLVTPMDRPGVPSAEASWPLLRAMAGAGASGLMLFGSNGEGPLLPTAALGDFARGVAERWRAETGGRGRVLVNVTAAGTTEALARADAVLPSEPDALVLSPPIYFHHREDEILAHYAAFGDMGVDVVAYNAPRYSNPLSPSLIDALAALPHLAGMKDSSGDPALLSHAVAAARRHPGFGVSQGDERRLLQALRSGAHGVVPGVANLAPGLAVELVAAHREGRAADAERAQRLIVALLALHAVRPGVPAVKAILAGRGLIPPHAAAPFAACTPAERRDLDAVLAPHDAHLLRSPAAP